MDVKEKSDYAQYILQHNPVQQVESWSGRVGRLLREHPRLIRLFYKKGNWMQKCGTGSRKSWDHSTAQLVQRCFHMDALTTVVTKRKEKGILHHIQSFVVSFLLTSLFLLLCTDFYPFKQKKRNLLSLFTKERTIVPWLVMKDLTIGP